MKKKLLWIAVFVLIALASCSVSYQVLIKKCLWWSCAPERNFSISEFEIPQDYYPANAQVPHLYTDDLNSSVEAASKTVYWSEGLSIYSIRRFATVDHAIEAYNHDFDSSLLDYPKESHEQYSVVLNHKSEFSDDEHITCLSVNGDARCVWLARYHEYQVFFSASMGENEMTTDNFVKVLTYIDRRFQELIDEY